jgi:hypothetical protein
MSRLRAALTVLAWTLVFTALMLVAMRYRDRDRGPITFIDWQDQAPGPSP